MSWSHQTFGGEYESFKQALEIVKVPFEENEGVLTFVTPDSRRMVAERYLSRDDGDCDGTTIYDLAVYEEGQRPELYTWVRDGGSEGITYPAPNDIWEFEYCLNDGHWSEPYSEEEYDEDEWLSYLDDELSDEDDELSSEGSKDG